MELEKQTSRQIFVDLYAEMQEFTASLFEYVENVAGEDTETAALIRELYEMLYKTSTGEVKPGMLNKYIGRIEICSEREFRADKLEIAFLCYNARMSDSRIENGL